MGIVMTDEQDAAGILNVAVYVAVVCAKWLKQHSYLLL